MTFPAIRLEGAILSADLLDSIERGDKNGQKARDFGFDPTAKVKDEISSTWATAKALWTAYQAKLSTLREGAAGTTETRNLFVIPLLTVLGYAPELAEAEMLHGKSYAISHRDNSRDGLPIHIVGPFLSEPGSNPDRSSLDVRVKGVHRLSPHALVQEYLNLTEHLYGIVTNGHKFRLLRDSSRLIKLSFLEFDFERIFGEELFADFALFYRLLHASRMPANRNEAAQSIIELYHQDALDSGSRIREGLSKAVKAVILSLADGFLQHPHNHGLREFAAYDPQGKFPSHLYQHLLRLVYRILFLMVVEERGLVHDPGTSRRLREIYDQGYSLARLRRLSEKAHFVQARHHDAWLALRALFRLVDESGSGKKLGISPLGGDLFDSRALGPLTGCSLDNATLLGALRQLTLFTNPATKQRMRVNYGALNVEEFGSVYQGLLEFEPRVTEIDGKWHFSFALGDERSKTGSHYTPEELVQPLLKHSLDHLIREIHEKHSTAADREKALLALKVCDVACGSGHILLAAARRIGVELAILRSGDDQPSPSALREAVRDAIRHCIHGVDLNPLAVELCKVALWLEAHVPGEPLGFLDHHIKCGNAIVGFVTRDELDKGIPDEAFKSLPGDDKDIAAAFRKTNKDERKERTTGQKTLPLAPELQEKLDAVLARMRELSALPEHTPAEIAAKKQRYAATQSQDAYLLRQIAAIPIAQFYQPKTAGNKANLITDAAFRHHLAGRTPQGQATASAWALAERKNAFHWFLEFPDIIANGGFDCILGNPPYLGGQALSGTYGYPFCEYLRWQYAPTGLSELAVFFLRRIYSLLRPNGFTAFITTNSIKDGDVRKDGLEQVIAAGGTINMAVRGIKWPGVANLVVSLVSIHRGEWNGNRSLDAKPVEMISAFFEDSQDGGEPIDLNENADKVFQGSIFLGDGFLLTHEQAAALIAQSPKNLEVISPIINGQELNNQPNQEPGRSIINFRDWPMSKSREYTEPFSIVEEKVLPERLKNNRACYRDRWWIYAEPRPKLIRTLPLHSRCFTAAATTKYLNFSEAPTNRVFANTIYVFTTDRWDLYAIVQSTIHEVWARKYSGALETRLRYSPSDCFETFAFPDGQWEESNSDLAIIGGLYHEHRRELMSGLWLGLTDVYNLFHAPDLDARLAKLQQTRSKKAGWINEIPAEHRDKAGSLTLDQARDGILRLRDLHRELDQSVVAAYGWHHSGPDGPAINLGHDFHEVETLPENDRTRFTVAHGARKELIKRLLKLNHARAAEEANSQLLKFSGTKAPAKGSKRQTAESAQLAPSSAPELPGQRFPTPIWQPAPKQGINFRRGAIAAYAVKHLAHRNEFGRTQMEKVLCLAQHALGIDLGLQFQQKVAGPYSSEIHKIESLAAKQKWFSTSERRGGGAFYRALQQLEERVNAASEILGAQKARFDWLIDRFAKMNTEQTELLATTFMVWNDLLFESRNSLSEQSIIEGVYAWHPDKAKFTPSRITDCIHWMAEHELVPVGFGPRSVARNDGSLGSIPRPAGNRPTLSDDFYFLTLIPHLAKQSPGCISINRLLGALEVLTDSDARRRLVKSTNAEESVQWSKDHKRGHGFDSAAGALLSLLNDQTLLPAAGGILLSDPAKAVDSDWLSYDAHHALLLAELLPPLEAPILQDKFVAKDTRLQRLFELVA